MNYYDLYYRTHPIGTKYSIIIHGGASGYTKEDFERLSLEAGDEFPELKNLECLLNQFIYEYLEKADNMLKNGASAEDVCVSVISMLENNELFNAGKGGMKTVNGLFQMDASLMDGDKNYGATTLVQKIKNPIRMCQYLKNQYGVKMLGGNDADVWAETNGLDIIRNPSEYFNSPIKNKINEILKRKDKPNYGTVGCVVKDIYGKLCAGTSTGGINNKLDGRIGDSPIIGAGTYCSNEMGGISCTGTGEMFIRDCVAFNTLLLYNRRNVKSDRLSDFMKESLNNLPTQSGGIIGITPEGECFSYYTSRSMIYGYIQQSGPIITEMWKPLL